MLDEVGGRGETGAKVGGRGKKRTRGRCGWWVQGCRQVANRVPSPRPAGWQGPKIEIVAGAGAGVGHPGQKRFWDEEGGPRQNRGSPLAGVLQVA